MRRAAMGWRAIGAAVVMAALAGGAAPAPQATPQPVRGPAWRAPGGGRQLPLWPGTPPNAGDVRGPAEHTEISVNPKRFDGRPVTGVFDVATPTLSIYPAKRPGKGAAVLVFPGGGFKLLVMDLEGTEACDWMTARGITCAVVKYRVPNSNHHYDASCDCAVEPPHPTALQDAQRAIRLLRARAAELHVDPGKIGVLGFSAGGYLVVQTSNITQPAYAPVDAIDRVSSRPDFAVPLYPGHLCRKGDTLDPGIHVTKATPPTFLVQAWDDPVDEICNSTVYARALDSAGVPAEVHLFGSGGHAFALRATGHGVDRWTELLETWLGERGLL
ncbi:alpha/beta hydrolase [Sphingomonas azotifigens]|uniref:alpha/beta hydrolase n=1 Tax=Sphingomonas azotifigens TaxID=330920 RepID=UPI001C3FC1D2|nr:alpha/beta hydrolase [Sphingomonas azotifigens]